MSRLQLILPRRVVEYRCTIPGCGAEFADKGRGIKHAVECAKRHADEISEAAERREQSALGGPLDPEMWKWGRKRAAEGKQGFRRGRAA